MKMLPAVPSHGSAKREWRVGLCCLGSLPPPASTNPRPCSPPCHALLFAGADRRMRRQPSIPFFFYCWKGCWHESRVLSQKPMNRFTVREQNCNAYHHPHPNSVVLAWGGGWWSESGSGSLSDNPVRSLFLQES